MHLYIVYAHPAAESFCREVLHAFCLGLEEKGHTFEVNDLYKNEFLSEMDAGQYKRELGMDPDAALPLDVKAEHEKLAKADALVFIYPNWWSDVPAKLKGWFDRVWSYGYAYFYEKDGQRQSRVHPKKALVICTAGHTEEHLTEVGIAQSMRKIMLEDRLGNVGFEESRMEILGGMMPNDAKDKHANLKRVRELAVSL
jgi:NAD(P)H dehydrogenase (quinone)